MIPIRTLAVAAFAALGLVGAAGPAGAHHSIAMYDSTKLVTVTGTVKEFQWTNPHAILWVYAEPGKNGPADLWSFELSTSPGPLTRLGWSKHSINPGDKVTVEMNPLRENQNGGSLKKVTLVVTGQVLTTTAPLTQTANAR
jgi:hypothetical protein